MREGREVRRKRREKWREEEEGMGEVRAAVRECVTSGT
jgi:hypothetical protein